MPYIALQLVGMEAVLTVMGVGGNSSNAFVKDLPLLIAFVILACYTFVSGLRAPALIAFAKDALIYVMIIVAVIYIPIRLGGWSHIFNAAGAHLAKTNPKTGKPNGSLILAPAGEWPTPPSPWARPSPCSCTRTRSPASSPPGGAA